MKEAPQHPNSSRYVRKTQPQFNITVQKSSTKVCQEVERKKTINIEDLKNSETSSQLSQLSKQCLKLNNEKRKGIIKIMQKKDDLSEQ